MCGIVGANGPKRAFDLAQLVKDRGTRAWSMTLIDKNTFRIMRSHNAVADFNEETFTTALKDDWDYASIPSVIDPYFILHLQSPTAREYRFHPATGKFGKRRSLWHNGMIDSSVHSKIEGRPWDTQLLLDSINGLGDINWDNLNKFEGSFACYVLDDGNGLYAFRNAISPQFMKDGEFCSVKFDDAEKMKHNVVYNMLDGSEVTHFNNTYNPFGV